MKKLLLIFLLSSLSIFKAQETTYWSDNFDDKNISDWIIVSIGSPVTGKGWRSLQYLNSLFQPEGSPFLSSLSYTQFNNYGYLHPDEWAISPQIDLTNANSSEIIKFSWVLYENRFTPSSNEEHYEIYISEQKEVSGMLGQAKIYEETNVPVSTTARSVDISQWRGKKIYIGIRHFNTTFDIAVTQNASAVRFDDLRVFSTSGLAAQEGRSLSKVRFYPNPVMDELSILSDRKIQTVAIYGPTGQKMNVRSNSVNDRLDMRNYEAGVYIINVTFDDGRSDSFKVVKK
ncbi:T9SS type A sorting domain-containing protein [Elizabethkingia anophelis]|nr:T9SS type A sorting domain-containing protein [Elizabethkingia anophelis]